MVIWNGRSYSVRIRKLERFCHISGKLYNTVHLVSNIEHLPWFPRHWCFAIVETRCFDRTQIYLWSFIINRMRGRKKCFHLSLGKAEREKGNWTMSQIQWHRVLSSSPSHHPLASQRFFFSLGSHYELMWKSGLDSQHNHCDSAQHSQLGFSVIQRKPRNGASCKAGLAQSSSFAEIRERRAIEKKGDFCGKSRKSERGKRETVHLPQKLNLLLIATLYCTWDYWIT